MAPVLVVLDGKDPSRKGDQEKTTEEFVKIGFEVDNVDDLENMKCVCTWLFVATVFNSEHSSQSVDGVYIK
ncbi:17464_t:CDS:2, partial [Gigaspora margarita]